VICLVLEFREEKRTFAKVEGGRVDFFHRRTERLGLQVSIYTQATDGLWMDRIVVDLTPATSRKKLVGLVCGDRGQGMDLIPVPPASRRLISYQLLNPCGVN
jgi:hypothetical protein